tara:strand:- start:999 stop:1814 length:816 start_codon:yes stop_codon:yes gene_type:complete
VLLLTLGVLAISSDGFRRWDDSLEPLGRIAPVPMLPIRIPDRAPPVAQREPVAEEPAESPEPTAPVPATEESPAPRNKPKIKATVTQAISAETAAQPAAAMASKSENIKAEQAAQQGAATETEIPKGTGQLKVISLKGYSKVFIDGEYVNWTPMTVSLESGRHELVLEETNYHFEHREIVTVMPDKLSEKTIERRYKPARIRFIEFPPDATLEMNGQDMGSLGKDRSVLLNREGDFLFTVRYQGEIIKTSSVTFGVQAKDLLPGTTQLIRP